LFINDWEIFLSIKVSIIEDHSEFREGLVHLLNITPGFEVSGKFSALEPALEGMANSDIILLDIGLPGMSGVEGIPLIKEKFPSSKIIMVSVFDDDDHVFKAILAGADGYILKKTPPVKLLQSIEDAYEGGTPLTPTIAKKALAIFKKFVPNTSEESSLSYREIEVLNLITEGLENDEIAEQLFISIETVRNHIRHIYKKLHVHSKTQAVVKAIREGIV